MSDPTDLHPRDPSTEDGTWSYRLSTIMLIACLVIVAVLLILASRQ